MLPNRAWPGNAALNSDQMFWSVLHGGFEMVRDDDYLRQLLQEFEASAEWMHMASGLLSPNEEETKRDYHMLLLLDAGMLAQVGKISYRLTNTAHDFLALTRKNEVWEATKASVKSLSGASIQMLYRVAEGYAVNKLKEMGVPIE